MAELRSRRSNLAVPGSNPRFLEKAKGLPADQVFLDLEDACAPLAKPGARKNIVAALNEGGWGDKIRTVRVNDWTTEWTFQDVLEVVEDLVRGQAFGLLQEPGVAAGDGQVGTTGTKLGHGASAYQGVCQLPESSDGELPPLTRS